MEIIQRRVGPLLNFRVILHFAFCTLHLTAGLPWYTRHKTRNPESGCIRLSLLIRSSGRQTGIGTKTVLVPISKKPFVRALAPPPPLWIGTTIPKYRPVI